MPTQAPRQIAPALLSPAFNRRHVLVGSAGALAATGLSTWGASAAAQATPLPAFASWKDANATIVHSATTIETKRGAFGSSVITPTEQLYVP